MNTVTRILYTTQDPTVLLEGDFPLPALTVLLYRVCDNNPKKFEEAIRIIELFIKAGLDHDK